MGDEAVSTIEIFWPAVHVPFLVRRGGGGGGGFFLMVAWMSSAGPDPDSGSLSGDCAGQGGRSCCSCARISLTNSALAAAWADDSALASPTPESWSSRSCNNSVLALTSDRKLDEEGETEGSVGSGCSVKSEKSIRGPEGRDSRWVLLARALGIGFGWRAGAGAGAGRAKWARIDSRRSRAASRCAGITPSFFSFSFGLTLARVGLGGSPSRLPPLLI